jgi:anti-repressor protein
MNSIPVTSAAGNAQPLIPLLPITIDGAQVNAVNARDLHRFLEVGKEFANWVKDRIDRYGFVENKDFEVFSDSGKNPQGGRPAKEYALTLDMAKELAMVERNPKGKQARAYFIECERRALAATRPQVDPARGLIVQALRGTVDALDQHESRIGALEARLLAMEVQATPARAPQPIAVPLPLETSAPAVWHYHRNRISGDPVSVAEFAQSNGMGKESTYRWLRSMGHLDAKNLPTARGLSNGWFAISKDDRSRMKARITPEGQAFLVRRLYRKGMEV